MLTRERNGTIDGKDTSFTTNITEFSIRITRKNLASITAKKLDSRSFVRFGSDSAGTVGGSDHFPLCFLDLKPKLSVQFRLKRRD